MNELKVLIAYGSRFGSTEGISQEIAKILENNGIKVRLLNLREEKYDSSDSLNDYDGILVGSSIKVARWTKEAKKFLKENREQINNIKVRGLFVSSLDSFIPEKYENSKEKYLKNIISELELNISHYDAFGGIIDLSKSSKMNFIEKKLMKSVISKENDPRMDFENGKLNDFRNWERVKEFAKEFSSFLHLSKA